MTKSETKKQRFRLRKKAAEGYMTTKETAKFLGVSVRSVHRYIHEYGLPAVKPAGIWMIKKADLERWMKENGS